MEADLSDIYRGYIACLNAQDWPNLGRFVHGEVEYNGKRIGLSGYRAMLEGDFRAIPDLHFDIRLLVCEPPHVASRLRFDCTPTGMLFGLPVAVETSAKDRSIDGNATFTIERSRATMNAADTVTANTVGGIPEPDRFIMQRSIAREGFMMQLKNATIGPCAERPSRT